MRVSDCQVSRSLLTYWYNIALSRTDDKKAMSEFSVKYKNDLIFLITAFRWNVFTRRTLEATEAMNEIQKNSMRSIELNRIIYREECNYCKSRCNNN
jgi:hypothetical protein